MAALTKLTTNINLEMSGDTKRYLVSAKSRETRQHDSSSQGCSTTANRTQSRQGQEQSSTLQNRTENMYITHVHIPVRM